MEDVRSVTMEPSSVITNVLIVHVTTKERRRVTPGAELVLVNPTLLENSVISAWTGSTDQTVQRATAPLTPSPVFVTRKLARVRVLITSLADDVTSVWTNFTERTVVHVDVTRRPCPQFVTSLASASVPVMYSSSEIPELVLLVLLIIGWMGIDVSSVREELSWLTTCVFLVKTANTRCLDSAPSACVTPREQQPVTLYLVTARANTSTTARSVTRAMMVGIILMEGVSRVPVIPSTLGVPLAIRTPGSVIVLIPITW